MVRVAVCPGVRAEAEVAKLDCAGTRAPATVEMPAAFRFVPFSDIVRKAEAVVVVLVGLILTPTKGASHFLLPIGVARTMENRISLVVMLVWVMVAASPELPSQKNGVTKTVELVSKTKPAGAVI